MQAQGAAATGVPDFAREAAAGEEWVIDLQKRLGWQDRDKAYIALLSTLHALRDHLPTDEVASLGAGLPALLRGHYYEGWHPREQPMRLDDREAFLSRIHETLHRELGIDSEEVARCVFELLSERITAPEFEEVKAACPGPLHGLWPD